MMLRTCSRNCELIESEIFPPRQQCGTQQDLWKSSWHGIPGLQGLKWLRYNNWRPLKERPLLSIGDTRAVNGIVPDTG